MVENTVKEKKPAAPKKAAAPKKEAAPKAAEAKKEATSAKKPAAKKEISGATITVRMIGSPIRRDSRQREYLKGLGLKKMNQTRELVDTPEVRGLIRKANHMVEIVA